MAQGLAQDPDLVRELTAIAGDDKEIEDRFYRGLEFGTAGMRGVIGYGTNRMNAYNVRRATQALPTSSRRWRAGRSAAWPSPTTRAASPRSLPWRRPRVLCANGIKVYLYESLRPVPVLSFTVRHLHCIAGIVITASHNPKIYNGYKVYWEDGGQLPPERASEVLSYINALDYASAKTMDEQAAKDAGLLTIIGKDVDDVYISRVRALCVQPELCREMGQGPCASSIRPSTAPATCPCAASSRKSALRTSSSCPSRRSPTPTLRPWAPRRNPENYSAFDLARALAVRENADVIFATDPDCDRLGCLVRAGDGSFIVLTRQPDRLHPGELRPLRAQGRRNPARKRRGRQVHRLYGHGQDHRRGPLA